MQESVTHVRLKKCKKGDANLVIFAILFFLIIFFLTAILVVSKKSNLCFESRKFYFVYALKEKNSELLLDAQKEVRDKGGAGVIYKKNKDFYLIISSYQNYDDAKQVSNSLKNEYKNCDIVEVVSKGVSRKYRNIIKENQDAFVLYEQIYIFFDYYEKLCYSFVTGGVGDGKYISSLISKKLELEKLIENLKISKNETINILVKFASEVVDLIGDVFDKFYISKNKYSLCYDLFVQYCLSFVNMCDNLQ